MNNSQLVLACLFMLLILSCTWILETAIRDSKPNITGFMICNEPAPKGTMYCKPYEETDYERR